MFTQLKLRNFASVMLRKKLKTGDDPSDSNMNRNSRNDSITNEILPFAVVSRYFPRKDNSANIALSYLAIESEMIDRLNDWLAVSNLRDSKIEYVYQPLEYAANPHRDFAHRYCNSTKKILFMGINPGPFGMCQTGVPFGDVVATRDWLKICAEVGKPKRECPEKRILGFGVKRSEVSGKKFWGLFKELCGTPDVFFKSSFVYNYCPLAFLDAKGINLTPDKIKSNDLKQLENICDETFFKVVELLQIDTILAIGRYIEKKVNKILASDPKKSIAVHYMKHPSPMVPNNANWDKDIEKRLEELNLLSNFKQN